MKDALAAREQAPPPAEVALPVKAAPRPARKRAATVARRTPRKQTPEPPAAPDPRAVLDGMKRRYADPRPQLGARVRPETAERIRRFVGMTGVPLQEVVDLAINTWLDQMEIAAYGTVSEDG